MVTVAELEAAVEGYDGGYYDGPWQDLYPNSSVEVGLYTLEYVEKEGGYEGGGEELWVVFKVGDQYFRKSGYYASYDGSTWDGALEEVEPYVEPKTLYRRRG